VFFLLHTTADIVDPMQAFVFMRNYWMSAHFLNNQIPRGSIRETEHLVQFGADECVIIHHKLTIKACNHEIMFAFMHIEKTMFNLFMYRG